MQKEQREPDVSLFGEEKSETEGKRETPKRDQGFIVVSEAVYYLKPQNIHLYYVRAFQTHTADGAKIQPSTYLIVRCRPYPTSSPYFKFHIRVHDDHAQQQYTTTTRTPVVLGTHVLGFNMK